MQKLVSAEVFKRRYCKMMRLGAYILLISLLDFGIGAKLPSSFQVCRRHDPELNNCFSRAVEHALPYLNEPIPELKLPSMQPARIESITVEPDTTGVANVTDVMTNVEIFDLLKSKIKKTDLILGDEDVKGVFHVYNEHIRSQSNYDINGTIFSLPIVGNGRGYVALKGVDVVITIKGSYQEKKNQKYIKLQDVKVKMDARKVIFTGENLFNGNEKLGAEMNTLVNENWKKLWNDVKWVYEEAMSVYFKSIFGAVYDRVPFDELFPL